MPLLHGKSEKAFKHNVKAEYEAGKPLKQSLAIAYSMKKKRMAEGGPVDPAKDNRLQSHADERMGCAPDCNEEHEHDRHDEAGEPMMAEGGQIVDNYNSPSTRTHQTKDGGVDPQRAYAPDHEGDMKRPNDQAMFEDGRKLNQHGEVEQGPEGHEPDMYENGAKMAEGGFITDNKQSDSRMLDMVGRIMKQRQQMFSEGGRVANSSPANRGTDYLANEDYLEQSYTGANSGDELSSQGEDNRRRDIVSKIMASRRKKDRLPNPR